MPIKWRSPIKRIRFMPPNLTSTMSAASVDSPLQHLTSRSLNSQQTLSLPLSHSLDKSMHQESERLKSFSGWRVPFLSPATLAKAGFYYLKRDDLVRCPFCGVEVHHWEDGDDPLADHKKWSSSCRFVNNQMSSDVGPTGSSEMVVPPSTLPRESRGEDVCGPYGMTQLERSFENTVLQSSGESEPQVPLGVYKSKMPAYSEFTLLERRLDSFKTWPVSLKIKPKDLSNAGFFYTGKGDETLCFYCGGGLKDWEEDDDPWQEHAKWFSKCNFMLMKKGHQFVADVLNKQKSNESNLGGSSRSATCESPVDDSESSRHLERESDSGVSSGDEKRENLPDRVLCKICYTEEIAIAFLPCGHLMACVNCAVNMKECGICRKPIESMFRTFLS